MYTNNIVFLYVLKEFNSEADAQANRAIILKGEDPVAVSSCTLITHESQIL